MNSEIYQLTLFDLDTVWENVPGAFSSAEGEDFRAVIEEIIRIKDSTCDVPRPASASPGWTPSRGVDTELFSPCAAATRCCQWGLGPDDLAVLYVGRVALEKNLALLEKAFAAIEARHPAPAWCWSAAGRRWAGCAVASRGRCAPACRPAPPSPSASGDLFLFPSLTETYGNVVAEALASGLPWWWPTGRRGAGAGRSRQPRLAGRARRRGRLRGRRGESRRRPGAARARQSEAARERVAALGWSAIIERLVGLQRQVIAAAPVAPGTGRKR